MKLGLFAPLANPIATPEFVEVLGRETDAAGFDSLWVADQGDAMKPLMLLACCILFAPAVHARPQQQPHDCPEKDQSTATSWLLTNCCRTAARRERYLRVASRKMREKLLCQQQIVSSSS